MPSAATEARLQAVEALLLAGGRRSDVVALCADRYGLAPRSADRLLALARARIRDDWAEVQRPAMVAEVLSQLSTLQRQAREAGDLAVALGCIQAAARVAMLG
jgi:hypothetical protein